MKKHILTIYTMLLTACLWVVTSAAFAQEPPSFGGLSDVILLDWQGETLAFVSSHNSTDFQVHSATGASSATQLNLGDYLLGELDGQSFLRMHVFGDEIRNLHGSTPEVFLMANQLQADMYFGRYDGSQAVGSFTASNLEFTSQIVLNWTGVVGAEGYLIFREDLNGPYPLAVIEGQQLTTYTDLELELFTPYTYYIVPFSLADGGSFLGATTMVMGHTKGFNFSATSDNEATVTFEYDFDNHFLVNLDQQAAYVEIIDEGLNEVVYQETITLTDVAESDLLFDYALDVTGTYQDGGGVYAQSNLGALDTWTIEMWFNFDGSSPHYSTHYHHLYHDGAVQLMTDRTSKVLIAEFNGEQFRWQGNIPDWREWTHLSVTYDGSQMAVYYNGAPAEMYKVGTSEVGYTHPIANGSLNAAVNFGQPLNGLPDIRHGNTNGSMGMIRMWDQARTASQVALDYDHLFDAPVPGLLAQWTFANQDLSPADDIHSNVLTLQTANETQHPIRWSTAYDFITAEKTQAVSVWLEKPEVHGATRTYTANLYEVGSGRLLSSSQDWATFSHPGAPGITATANPGTPYMIEVDVAPVSTKADRYRVYRELGEESWLIATVDPDPNTLGYEAFTVTDTYTHGDAPLLQGGNSYTYSAQPVYTQMASGTIDTQFEAITAPLTLLDFVTSIAPNTDESGVTFAWDETALTNAGYDTLRLERNGTLLAYVPVVEQTYTDTLMLYGDKYQYRAVIVENGIFSLSQADSAQLQPNGTLSGTLISAQGEYALPSVSLSLTDAPTQSALQTLTTDANGEFSLSGLYYGATAHFGLVGESTLSPNAFSLSRTEWDSNLGFVTYDVNLPEVFTQNLIQNLTVNGQNNANGIRFDWTTPTLPTGTVAYTNVYRNDSLVTILSNAISYIDYGAMMGEQNYRFQAYHYNATYDTVQVSVVDSVQAIMPGITGVNDFTVAATSEGILSIDWSYPVTDPIHSFTVHRTNTNSQESHIVAILPHQTGLGQYSLLDSLGFPGMNYLYTLAAHSLAEENHTMASETTHYPDLPTNQVVSQVAVNVDGNVLVDVILHQDILHHSSWDGIALVTEVGDLIPLEKSLTEAAELPFPLAQFRHPNPTLANGALGMRVYKHTDEGLYLSPAITKPYSGATVPNPGLQIPSAPTLSANDAVIQKPVLTASKDAKGKIFVAWSYPEYTDVTFILAHRTSSSGTWTTLELPNEQRAFLHESPPNQVVEYKLTAKYEDGRKSSEVWDYGVSHRYQRVEGYILDGDRNPQANVWVGIKDYWTLTDSTGYYRIEDLELTTGTNHKLYYMEPARVGNPFVTIQFGEGQAILYRDIFSTFTNRIHPLSDAEAAVMQAAGFSDPVHLTNEVRWSLNNDQYSGVKVYRGSGQNEVADLRPGITMVHVDSLLSNNAQGELYWIRPYKVDALGQIHFHNDGAAIVEDLDYPALTPPKYANAFSNIKEGTIRLSWAHERNNVDGYIILRDDEELGRVSANESSVFIDSLGIPGKTYRYSLYSYLERGNETIVSTWSKTIDTDYPDPGNPIAVTAGTLTMANTDPDNGVKVTWDYPTPVQVDGVQLYRGLDLVGTAAYPETSLIDSTGIPATFNTYTLRTYDKKEGREYTSDGVEVTAVLPALQTPGLTVSNPHFDSLLINWTYPQISVEALELFIINGTQGDTAVQVMIDRNEASGNYLFSQGISGHQYTVAIRAVSERLGETYYSAVASESLTYLNLPAPELYVSYVEGEQQATFSWTLGTRRHEGYYLTIDRNGVPYSTISPVDGEPIHYNQLPLPAMQGEFVFMADLADLPDIGAGGETFTATLSVHQDAVNGTPESSSQSVTMGLIGIGYYVQNLTASKNGLESIHLEWDAPQVTTNFLNYLVYRDGVLVVSPALGEEGLEDFNVFPGVSHVYEVKTRYTNDTLASTVRGNIVGDGAISSSLLTLLGPPVIGDSLQIEATVNGVPYQQVAISDAKGTVNFTGLAYDDTGIEYTIRPAGNPAHYDQEAITFTLSTSVNQGFAGIIYHILTRDLGGTVANVYCPDGCGRDSVEVTLHAYPVGGGARETLQRDKTDYDGSFNFEIPYYLHGYTHYQLGVSALPTNAQNEALEEFAYQYVAGAEATDSVGADGTRWFLLGIADLEATTTYQVSVTDTVNFPLHVAVAGPGAEEVFAGYEFTLRVRETSGRVDIRTETVNRKISLQLPPMEYEVSVIDVNKRDAFSMAVLDYLRSRALTLDLRETYLAYQEDPTSVNPDTVHYMRYNERATLQVSEEDELIYTGPSCEYFLMTTDDKSSSAAHTATLSVVPRQTINSIPCNVTSGYILVSFSGGEVQDENANDTLEWLGTHWEDVTLTATKPNMTYPHKQLLEFYYYDANGNYQGSTSMEIIVLGEGLIPGSDVFVILEEAQPVPLYVLRDPPGDQSYSYIKEGSGLMINLENSQALHQEASLGFEWKTKGGPAEAAITLKAQQGNDWTWTEGQMFKLEFQDGLNTQGPSISSENLEGYLDGPDADVIVGMDLLMAYGMTEILALEGCSTDKTRIITAQPAEVETLWAYTRSQINNSIRYYRDVVDENGDYQIQSSTNNAEDTEEIKTQIGASATAFETLLKEVDSKYTPLCGMCEFARDLDDSFLIDDDDFLVGWLFGADLGLGDIHEYKEQILAFCVEDNYFQNNTCPTYSIDSLIATWDQAKRDGFTTAYRKYLVLREAKHLYNNYWKTADDGIGLETETLSRIAGFNPLENITFSGGAAVSREWTNSWNSTDSYAHTGFINITGAAKTGAEAEFNVSAWFGFGGGLEVEGLELSSSFHLLVDAGVKYSGSTKEVITQEGKSTIGMVLNDNDEGDHFSVNVMQGGAFGKTFMTPYFGLVGGRSSCPYEEGTIARDMPTIQIMDTEGNLQPSKWFDLNPNASHAIPLAISSGNPFGESRFVSLVTQLGSNQHGMGLSVSSNGLSPAGGATLWVEPDTVKYVTLYASKGASPLYDFEDIKLLVKPRCAVGDFFEADHIFDTLGMEFHYRKPISSIALSSPMGSWYIKDEAGTDTESTTFKLSGYDVEQLRASMKEVVLQYKRTNGDVWTNMQTQIQPFEEGEQGTDWETVDVLKVDFLLSYYQKLRNTYPEPEFPFVWEIPFDLLDGSYQVRAMIVHENGSVGYSNLLVGTVDRTHPVVSGTPAPADGLLSETDELSISFSELIDVPVVQADHANVSVEITAEDGQLAYTLLASEYSFAANKNKVAIMVTDAIRQAYDGRTMEVTVTGIQDAVGNLADPASHTWSFQLDYTKQTPSPVSLIG
ncbi:MAG: LamG-like jellyroll fold domain-containing protein, partial [Bacteroidota bacterium]